MESESVGVKKAHFGQLHHSEMGRAEAEEKLQDELVTTARELSGIQLLKTELIPHGNQDLVNSGGSVDGNKEISNENLETARLSTNTSVGSEVQWTAQNHPNNQQKDSHKTVKMKQFDFEPDTESNHWCRKGNRLRHQDWTWTRPCHAPQHICQCENHFNSAFLNSQQLTAKHVDLTCPTKQYYIIECNECGFKALQEIRTSFIKGWPRRSHSVDSQKHAWQCHHCGFFNSETDTLSNTLSKKSSVDSSLCVARTSSISSSHRSILSKEHNQHDHRHSNQVQIHNFSNESAANEMQLHGGRQKHQEKLIQNCPKCGCIRALEQQIPFLGHSHSKMRSTSEVLKTVRDITPRSTASVTGHTAKTTVPVKDHKSTSQSVSKMDVSSGSENASGFGGITCENETPADSIALLTTSAECVISKNSSGNSPEEMSTFSHEADTNKQLSFARSNTLANKSVKSSRNFKHMIEEMNKVRNKMAQQSTKPGDTMIERPYNEFHENLSGNVVLDDSVGLQKARIFQTHSDGLCSMKSPLTTSSSLTNISYSSLDSDANQTSKEKCGTQMVNIVIPKQRMNLKNIGFSPSSFQTPENDGTSAVIHKVKTRMEPTTSSVQEMKQSARKRMTSEGLTKALDEYQSITSKEQLSATSSTFESHSPKPFLWQRTMSKTQPKVSRKERFANTFIMDLYTADSHAAHHSEDRLSNQAQFLRYPANVQHIIGLSRKHPAEAAISLADFHTGRIEIPNDSQQTISRTSGEISYRDRFPTISKTSTAQQPMASEKSEPISRDASHASTVWQNTTSEARQKSSRLERFDCTDSANTNSSMGLTYHSTSLIRINEVLWKRTKSVPLRKVYRRNRFPFVEVSRDMRFDTEATSKPLRSSRFDRFGMNASFICNGRSQSLDTSMIASEGSLWKRMNSKQFQKVSRQNRFPSHNFVIAPNSSFLRQNATMKPSQGNLSSESFTSCIAPAQSLASCGTQLFSADAILWIRTKAFPAKQISRFERFPRFIVDESSPSKFNFWTKTRIETTPGNSRFVRFDNNTLLNSRTTQINPLSAAGYTDKQLKTTPIRDISCFPLSFSTKSGRNFLSKFHFSRKALSKLPYKSLRYERFQDDLLPYLHKPAKRYSSLLIPFTSSELSLVDGNLWTRKISVPVQKISRLERFSSVSEADYSPQKQPSNLSVLTRTKMPWGRRISLSPFKLSCKKHFASLVDIKTAYSIFAADSKLVTDNINAKYIIWQRFSTQPAVCRISRNYRFSNDASEVQSLEISEQQTSEHPLMHDNEDNLNTAREDKFCTTNNLNHSQLTNIFRETQLLESPKAERHSESRASAGLHVCDTEQSNENEKYKLWDEKAIVNPTKLPSYLEQLKLDFDGVCHNEAFASTAARQHFDGENVVEETSTTKSKKAGEHIACIQACANDLENIPGSCDSGRREIDVSLQINSRGLKFYLQGITKTKEVHLRRIIVNGHEINIH